MIDATKDFFEGLKRRGHEPLLEKANGTLRFDLMDGGGVNHWLVTIRKGDLTVTRGKGEADCSMRVDREVFRDIITGKMNAMAAVLRGVATIDGDPRLLVLLQRLFPGPANASERGRPARYTRGLP